MRTVNDASQQPYPRDWPEQAVTPFDRSDAPCLTLTTDRDKAATVQLAAPLSDSPVAGSGTVRTVESGHGALVQATSGGVIGSGTIFLVDSTGTRYAVGTKSDPAPPSPRSATRARSRCRCRPPGWSSSGTARA